MRKIAAAAFASFAALALSACGSSDSAKEEAAPDNVEMPAEESVNDVDANATVAPEAATATDAAAAGASQATPAAKQ